MTIDLAGLKKLTEECHEVTICWFDKKGRHMGATNGCPELMGQLLQHIDELSSLQNVAKRVVDNDPDFPPGTGSVRRDYSHIARACEAEINAQDQEREQGDFSDQRSRTDIIHAAIKLLFAERNEEDAEVERALRTVVHWTTDFASQTEAKKNRIVSGLRDFCGDALKKMRGEREQTPEERITYLVRALGSIAHVCANNPEPLKIPWEVRGIVGRAIRGVPNPISAVGPADAPPRVSGVEDRVRAVPMDEYPEIPTTADRPRSRPLPESRNDG